MNSSTWKLCSALTGAFCVTIALHEGAVVRAERKFLSPPPEYIEYFHFGFKDSVADSLWLRWIQDSDTCQTYGVKAAKAYVQSEDPMLRNPRHKECDNSWAFKMLDAVTRLAPRFHMPYVLGAISLSVLVEDYDGASVLFDRGVENYPGDWMILYRAAYHFMYDKHELEKAAELLTRAADNGAPVWVRSLASKLYSKTGQLELSLRTLQGYLESVENPETKADIQKRIHELEARLNNKEP